jgi:hypothetical protein
VRGRQSALIRAAAPHSAPVACVRPSVAREERPVAVDHRAVVTTGPKAVGDLAKVARERREASRDLRALEDDPRSPANDRADPERDLATGTRGRTGVTSDPGQLVNGLGRGSWSGRLV